MKMKNEELETKWISPEIVCSFPHLSEPADEQYGGKFSLSIPLPKSNTEAYTKLQVVIRNAAVKKWGEEACDLKGIKTFIDDCEEDDDPVYKGCYKFSAKATRRPGLVYPNMEPVDKEDIEDVFFPGAIIRVSVNAYGTETGGGKTVAFGLNNVMIVRDGDRIGGGSKPGDDFSAFKEESFDKIEKYNQGNLF